MSIDVPLIYKANFKMIKLNEAINIFKFFSYKGVISTRLMNLTIFKAKLMKKLFLKNNNTNEIKGSQHNHPYRYDNG